MICYSIFFSSYMFICLFDCLFVCFLCCFSVVGFWGVLFFSGFFVFVCFGLSFWGVAVVLCACLCVYLFVCCFLGGLLLLFYVYVCVVGWLFIFQSRLKECFEF